MQRNARIAKRRWVLCYLCSCAVVQLCSCAVVHLCTCACHTGLLQSYWNSSGGCVNKDWYFLIYLYYTTGIKHISGVLQIQTSSVARRMKMKNVLSHEYFRFLKHTCKELSHKWTKRFAVQISSGVKTIKTCILKHILPRSINTQVMYSLELHHLLLKSKKILSYDHLIHRTMLLNKFVQQNAGQNCGWDVKSFALDMQCVCNRSQVK